MALILHVGFQKTATTTLQDCVFSRHSGIVNLGKPDFNGDTTWSRALGHLISAKGPRFKREWCHGIIHRVVEEVGRSGKVGVVSHEGLTNIYQNPPELIAERLRDAFGEVRVLLTVREQLAFIQSFYLHYVSYGLFRGTAQPFGRWLDTDESLDARSAIRHADFSRTVERYRALFGEDRVHVLPFELFLRDRAAFAARLADAMEIGRQEMSDLVGGATNRKERTSVRVYRFAVLNGALVPPHLRSWCRRALPDGVKAGVENWLRAGDRVRLPYPPGKAEHLRERYRPGNRSLATQYGLDLEGYGYAL
jgi:hypothetical protein